MMYGVNFSLYANSVYPLGSDVVISNGEIYTVAIETSLNIEELKKLKNTKINQIMYVMDVYPDRSPKQFKIFILDPPKKKKKNENEKDLFSIQRFQYKPEQKQDNPELFSFSGDNLMSEQAIWKNIIYGSIAVFLFIIIFFVKGFINLRRDKKKYQQEIEERKKNIIELFKKAKTREDFERVHSYKQEILSLVKNEDHQLLILLKGIYKIQYKESWLDAELEHINSLKKKLDIEDIFNGV